MLDEIRKERKYNTKNDLEDLMQAKRTREELDTVNEKIVDKGTIQGLQKTFFDEEKRRVEIEKEKKLKNKKEWIAMQKMNEKAKKVEKLF